MLMIRLQRLGKSKQPSYRVIVSDKLRDTQYGSLEILGTYQTLGKTPGLTVKEDRVKYWLSVGAQASTTLHNIFVDKGWITAKKQKSVFLSKKRRAALEAEKAKVAPAA